MAHTVAEARREVLKVLELAHPAALSAGEVTTVLNEAGTDVRRSSVKSHLDGMLKSGDVMGEFKNFERNGLTVRGTAYMTKRTWEINMAKLREECPDPFAGFEMKESKS